MVSVAPPGILSAGVEGGGSMEGAHDRKQKEKQVLPLFHGRLGRSTCLQEEGPNGNLVVSKRTAQMATEANSSTTSTRTKRKEQAMIIHGLFFFCETDLYYSEKSGITIITTYAS